MTGDAVSSPLFSTASCFLASKTVSTSKGTTALASKAASIASFSRHSPQERQKPSFSTAASSSSHPFPARRTFRTADPFSNVLPSSDARSRLSTASHFPSFFTWTGTGYRTAAFSPSAVSKTRVNWFLPSGHSLTSREAALMLSAFAATSFTEAPAFMLILLLLVFIRSISPFSIVFMFS